MDGKVVSVSGFDSMEKELEGIELVTNLDLIGEIWENRPQAVLSKAFILDEKYTGKSAKEKIEEVRSMLAEKRPILRLSVPSKTSVIFLMSEEEI